MHDVWDASDDACVYCVGNEIDHSDLGSMTVFFPRTWIPSTTPKIIGSSTYWTLVTWKAGKCHNQKTSLNKKQTKKTGQAKRIEYKKHK